MFKVDCIDVVKPFEGVPDIVWMSSGSSAYDEKFKGLPDKGLSIFGAYPGHGKSMFLLQLSLSLVHNVRNLAVFYYSCENSVSVDKGRLASFGTVYNAPMSAWHYRSFVGVDMDKDPLDWIVEDVEKDTHEKKIVLIDSPVDLVRHDLNENDLQNYEAFVRKLASLGDKYCVVINWHLKRNESLKGKMDQRMFESIESDPFQRTSVLGQKAVGAFIIDYQPNEGDFWVRCLKNRMTPVDDRMEMVGFEL